LRLENTSIGGNRIECGARSARVLDEHAVMRNIPLK
jgi:hypothetical protein